MIKGCDICRAPAKGRHAKRPNKSKSGEELTASEMKVCLEVCKTYSTDNLNKKPENI